MPPRSLLVKTKRLYISYIGSGANVREVDKDFTLVSYVSPTVLLTLYRGRYYYKGKVGK